MKRSDKPSHLRFTAEDGPNEAAFAALGEGLSAHSKRLGLPGDWTPHWILGRDADGALQAGVRFITAFDWLFVHLLWVAEAYRGQGVGSWLLAGAEDAARAKGCRSAYLDTFTFQAPKFYEKRGYREFGRLDDFPPGHSRIFLEKRFLG